MTNTGRLTYDERVALVQQREVPITLDGERAKICGYRNDFASVRAVKSGFSVEFAWSTVACIVARGGRFEG